FTVHDPANKNAVLGGEQDDDNDSLHPFGFYTRTADPGPYKFTAPADGKYLVAVGAGEARLPRRGDAVQPVLPDGLRGPAGRHRGVRRVRPPDRRVQRPGDGD